MKIFIRRKIPIASAVFSTLITVGCEKPDLKSKTTSSNEPIAINTEDSKLKNERQSITKETIKKCEENLSKAGDQYNYYFQKNNTMMRFRCLMVATMRNYLSINTSHWQMLLT